MKKIGISLAVISISTMMLAGCGVNNNNDNLGNGNNGNNGTNGTNGMTTRSYHNGNQSLLGNGNYRNFNNGNAGNNAGGQKKFKDISTGEWYAENVQWGADNEIIGGYPDGSFQPNKPITRAEVIKIINTMADRGFFNMPATTPDETPTPSPTATPGTDTTPTATPDTAGTDTTTAP